MNHKYILEEYGNTLHELKWNVSLGRVFNSIDIMLEIVLGKDSSGDTMLVEMEKENSMKIPA